MTKTGHNGHALARAVDEVKSLLKHGELQSSLLWQLEGLRAAGLWRMHDDSLVATPAIVELSNRLPNAEELIPAVFSFLPEVRATWLRVVRARLAEMGERKDIAALTNSVSAVGELASELVTADRLSLSPTAFSELERSILPAAAHEASAFPVLLRVLAATTVVPSSALSQPLPEIVFDDPSTAWRPGRLLRLPKAADPVSAKSVLSGALDGPNSGDDSMIWTLQHPWAFLLAQMTFTKEAWEAERVSGGIVFEIEPGYVSLFQNPPCVQVVVTLPSGEEIRCGSLGELVQRTLAQLGVTILGHRVTASSIDEHLGIVIDAVQRRDVWRFEHGSGSQRPAYFIHPSFSDTCYRTLGSRAFYRLGSHLTAAIRRAAETWAQERIARVNAAISEEAA